MPAPTPAQVRKFVGTIRSKVRDARVIGIRASEWTGPDAIDVENVSFRVALCLSPLEVREQLVDLDAGDRLVVLTPFGEDELGLDVAARLAKRRIHTIEPWGIVLDLFKARTVDPRVRTSRWIAETLIDGAPPGGYTPVATGVLDLDTVWEVLLVQRFAMPNGRPDVLSLLRWAGDASAVDRYRGAAAEIREGVRGRTLESAGLAGVAVLDAIELGYGGDVVALGLASRVLFDPAREQQPALREAAVRFERFNRAGPLPAAAALQWAEAAEQLLGERRRDLGWPAARSIAERADAILVDLGAAAYLGLGPWSPAGFEQRLSTFAAALAAYLPRPSLLPEVERTASDGLDHRVARAESDRVHRLEMARRLARWLHRDETSEPTTLVDAARRYAGEGAFVDLARTALLPGDQLVDLSRSYAALREAVRLRRERQNAVFGRLLAASAAAPPPSQRALVPVERVLETVLAPLAAQAPVLLLVVDGLSRLVFIELLEEIADEGWRQWQPQKSEIAGLPWAALAAVPSITAISRTSLLSGTIRSGDASDEKRAFTAHRALLAASPSNRPPVLLHKAELRAAAGRGLADAARRVITASETRVVGLVINAVDDLLFKGDQIQLRWSLEAIPLLRDVLAAAREGGRLVVLVSDHGHLLEDEMTFLGREAGERWRADSGVLAEGETCVEGPRVLGGGKTRVVVPWSEAVRYSPRRNGYHGGASPQEMVLPLAALSPDERSVAGFERVALSYPEWWLESAGPPTAAAHPREPAPAALKKAAPLLDLLETPVTPDDQSPVWIEALLASSLMTEQRDRAGRAAPPVSEMRRLLIELGSRGGTLTRMALAHRLGLPPVRLNGLLAAARRLLNVEGEPVLGVSDESVTLNRPLLEKQFEITRQ